MYVRQPFIFPEFGYLLSLFIYPVLPEDYPFYLSYQTTGFVNFIDYFYYSFFISH